MSNKIRKVTASFADFLISEEVRKLSDSQAESITGGATDGPACYPWGYYLPDWYILGNEGGREGEYSGSYD